MYLIPLLAISFLAIFFEAKVRFNSPLVLSLSVFSLAIFIGLRFEVGTDWELIYANFLRLTTVDADFGWFVSPFFNLLSLASSSLGFSIFGVNFVCALIFLLGLSSLLVKLSRPWLSLCLFYPYYILVFSFNFDRQSAALGIAMFALSQLLVSRRKRFLILLLIAATFHPTVLILLPLFFTAESITRKSYLFFVATWASLLLLSAPFFMLYLRYNLDNFIYNYFGAGYIYVSQGLWFRLVPLLFSAFFVFFYRHRLHLSRFQYSVYYFLGVIVVVLSVIALSLPSFSTVVDRLSAYASPLLLFAGSEAPGILKTNGIPSKLSITLLVSYSLTLCFVWLVFSNYAKYWIPYQNIILTGMFP